MMPGMTRMVVVALRRLEGVRASSSPALAKLVVIIIANRPAVNESMSPVATFAS